MIVGMNEKLESMMLGYQNKDDEVQGVDGPDHQQQQGQGTAEPPKADDPLQAPDRQRHDGGGQAGTQQQVLQGQPEAAVFADVV